VDFPANLQDLTFGQRFNQTLEGVKMPNLQSLKLGASFNQNMAKVSLPDSQFERLELLTLPAGLQSLICVHSLEGVAWPINLQYLTFGFGFNESLVHATLPDGLQSLTFGERFNKSLEHVILPASLQSLTSSEAFNQGLERVTLPSGLQDLTFDDSFNQSLDGVTWPIGLKRKRLLEATSTRAASATCNQWPRCPLRYQGEITHILRPDRTFQGLSHGE